MIFPAKRRSEVTFLNIEPFEYEEKFVCEENKHDVLFGYFSLIFRMHDWAFKCKNDAVFYLALLIPYIAYLRVWPNDQTLLIEDFKFALRQIFYRLVTSKNIA